MADRCFRAGWGCAVFATFAGMAHPAGRHEAPRAALRDAMPSVYAAAASAVPWTDQMQANTLYVSESAPEPPVR